ncbi:MAG: DUF4097 domain-containing protein [Bacilli bacterium]|nr:DUF4097 domain-containing protein [Bacilli bacterium]
MKTFGKLAIAGTVLLLAGATVGAVGGVIAYQNKEGEVTNKVEKQYVATGAASALKIKTFSGKVHLKKGDVETVQIDYKDEEESPKIEFTFADGVLTMKEQERPWYTYVNIVWPWNFDKAFQEETVITVPQDSDIDYKLDVASGSVLVENIETTKGLDIQCASGMVTVKDSSFGGSLDLDAVSGGVFLENLTVGENIKLDATSGTVNLKNIECGKTIDIDAISGEIKGENLKCEKLKTDATSGKIDLKKVNAEKSIDIGAVSGSIYLSVVDAKENYSISISKRSGSANVESRTDANAPKSMSLSATSGTINVNFEDK